MTKEMPTEEEIEEALSALPELEGAHESTTLNYWGCKALPTVKRAARMAVEANARAEIFEDALVLLLRDEDPTLTGDVLRAKPARELADLVYATVTRERHAAAVMRAGLDKANAARLAAEHDRDEARAAEEHVRQERDELKETARDALDECESLRIRLGDAITRIVELEEANRRLAGSAEWHRQQAIVATVELGHAGMTLEEAVRATVKHVAELEARLTGPTPPIDGEFSAPAGHTCSPNCPDH